MGVKVAKFGGSSVSDAIQFAKVKKIIEADPDRKYVVVSAPGKRFSEDNKVTDLLYLCKTHVEHNVPYDQVLQVIYDRYKSIELHLGLDAKMDEEFAEIKKNLEKGITEDYIASRGEYLNAILMAAYLGYDFVDTANIIQFDEHGRFLSNQTNDALGEVLLKHDNAGSI